MKKILSLLFSLFLIGTAAVPAASQVPVRNIIKGLRTTSIRSAELGRRIPKLRVYAPRAIISISAGLLPQPVLRNNKINIDIPTTQSSSLTAQVSAGMPSLKPDTSVQADLSSIDLTADESIELFGNLLHQGLVNRSDPVLSVAPHLWVERGFPRTMEQHNQVVKNYRNRLKAEINKSAPRSKQISEWAHQMAAVSNLGFFGTEKDIPTLLAAYQQVPEFLKPYTEVILGRALLAQGNLSALQQLAEFAAEDGELIGEFWAGVQQYAQETGLELQLPDVKEGSRLPQMEKQVQDSLESFNSLNKLHADPGLDATKDWLSLNEHKGTILPDASAPVSRTAQSPNGSETSEASAVSQTPEVAELENSATSASDSPAAVPPTSEPAISAQTRAQLNTPTFAKGLFTFSAGKGQKTGGVLGVFCTQKGIDFANRPFDAIQEAANYRDDLIAMLENNEQDIVAQMIKGMTPERLSILRHNFPPAYRKNGISRAGAEKIADLVLGLADPARAAKLLTSAPGGYLFLDYDDALTFSLKTEASIPDTPELSELVPPAKKADFIATFDARVGQTSRAEAAPTDKNRYFRFQLADSQVDVPFNDLANFVRNNPKAEFSGSFYHRIAVNNSGYGEAERIVSKQERVDAELKALEDILRTPDIPGGLLLDKSTVTENLEILNDLLQNMREEIRSYVNHLYPETNSAKTQITLRMGEHEVESGVSAVPFSNLHAHVETRIPEMNFGITFTLPIRVSNPIKEKINIKYGEWQEEGAPGPSFIEYVTAAPARAPHAPESVSRAAGEAGSIPAASSYSDMLPNELIPALVPVK